MAELKPCPFCGSTPVLVDFKPYGEKCASMYKVECTNENCMCKPDTYEYLLEEKAIDAWNRRADNGVH